MYFFILVLLFTFFSQVFSLCFRAMKYLKYLQGDTANLGLCNSCPACYHVVYFPFYLVLCN